MSENLCCNYCGKIKPEQSFFIGYSNNKDWVMHEGTGKVSCPSCNPLGYAESEKAIHGKCDLEKEVLEHSQKVNAENVKAIVEIIDGIILSIEKSVSQHKFELELWPYMIPPIANKIIESLPQEQALTYQLNSELNTWLDTFELEAESDHVYNAIQEQWESFKTRLKKHDLKGVTYKNCFLGLYLTFKPITEGALS